MLSLLLSLTLAGPPDVPDESQRPQRLQANPLADRIKFVLPQGARAVRRDAPARFETAPGDHWCPNCRSGQWTVQRQRANGWHSHVCGNCNTEFWHPDASNAPQMRRIAVAAACSH